MSNFHKKYCSYAFGIFFKRFFISRNIRSGEITIDENNRSRNFSLTVNMGGAAWLSFCLKSLLSAKDVRSFRKSFRGYLFSLCIDVHVNTRGTYMRVLKIAGGNVRSIIIPEGMDREGWLRLKKGIDFVLVGPSKISNQPLEGNKIFKSSVGGERNPKKSDMRVSYKDKVLVGLQRIGESKKLMSTATHCNIGPGVEKSPANALVLTRTNIHTSWGWFRDSIYSNHKIQVEPLPLAANRAIFWCNLEEKKRLLQTQGLFLREKNYETLGSVEDWSPFSHWEDIEIKADNSWIGIEGLPLNAWNIQTLRRIGDVCGGLLEISEETLDFSFLFYAKIKVRGFSSGLISPLLELPVDNLIINLGLFSLEDFDEEYGIRGFSTGLLKRREVGIKKVDWGLKRRVGAEESGYSGIGESSEKEPVVAVNQKNTLDQTADVDTEDSVDKRVFSGASFVAETDESVRKIKLNPKLMYDGIRLEKEKEKKSEVKLALSVSEGTAKSEVGAKGNARKGTEHSTEPQFLADGDFLIKKKSKRKNTGVVSLEVAHVGPKGGPLVKQAVERVLVNGENQEVQIGLKEDVRHVSVGTKEDFIKSHVNHVTEGGKGKKSGGPCIRSFSDFSPSQLYVESGKFSKAQSESTSTAILKRKPKLVFKKGLIKKWDEFYDPFIKNKGKKNLDYCSDGDLEKIRHKSDTLVYFRRKFKNKTNFQSVILDAMATDDNPGLLDSEFHPIDDTLSIGSSNNSDSIEGSSFCSSVIGSEIEEDGIFEGFRTITGGGFLQPVGEVEKNEEVVAKNGFPECEVEADFCLEGIKECRTDSPLRIAGFENSDLDKSLSCSAPLSRSRLKKKERELKNLQCTVVYDKTRGARNYQ